MKRLRLLPASAFLALLVSGCPVHNAPSTSDAVDPSVRAAHTRTPSWVRGGAARGRAGNDDASSRAAHGEGKRSGPSGAMQALQLWSAQRAYPGKAIPDAPYGVAIDVARRMGRVEAGGPDDDTDSWTAIGPANVGGRTLCLAIHPSDPNILFAGSASGGLWKSTTGGVGADAWDYVDTGYPVLGVSTIAIDSANPNVMYIGTGEGYDYSGSNGGEAVRTTRGSYGIGILKSIDGGATWTKSLDWTYAQSKSVWMIQIHPTNHDVLFAGTTDGVYKSTNAGGAWTLVSSVVMAMDVRIHPTQPDVVFAGHGNFGSAGHGIYRSTDGGLHWTKLTSGLPLSFTGKPQLAISALVPDTMYASLANVDPGIGLYRSTNRGDTWTLVNSSNYASYQGWYSHWVLVSPFTANTLFVGGIEIWRSTNSGTTLLSLSRWTDVFMNTQSPPQGPIGASRYAHADHHFAVWHPTQPSTIYFCSDGGIFKTTDLGATFQSLIGGYQTSQFYNGFSNAPADADFAMGGLQDNFTVVYEGSEAWRRVIGGDGTWTAIHPTNPAIVFGSAQYLQMFRSTDFGNSWTNVEPPEAVDDYTPFVAPYVLCPNQPTAMYAGRARVYRSDNSGTSWVATNGGAPLSPGNPVMSLAVATDTPDVAYAGTAPLASRARIFRTRNGGAAWTDITGPLPDRYPSDIYLDPADSSKVYVTFMGFGTSHVFKSANGGDTWVNIGAGLPDIPASAVVVDPDSPDVLYVGTDLGIYLSVNGGGTWQPFGRGMPLAMVNDLKVFGPGRKLRAATHGNGAWERDLFAACATGDTDSDGVCNAQDCAPTDPGAWQLPGEVTGLRATRIGAPGWASITWMAPTPTGGAVEYDVIASENPDDFETDASVRCVESDDGGDTAAVNIANPPSGVVFFYLVRAEHSCGGGPLGSDSAGAPRTATVCPMPE